VANEPEVRRLADLVAYEEASIVSRTLMDKETGTVTLFAFDAEQGLSEHTTPFDAMVTVLDGTGEITIAGQPYSVGQGEMLVMPPGKPHAVKAPERFKMLLVMIKS
jgi:quercetin dioxygenase-like cupin family protein